MHQPVNSEWTIDSAYDAEVAEAQRARRLARSRRFRPYITYKKITQLRFPLARET